MIDLSSRFLGVVDGGRLKVYDKEAFSVHLRRYEQKQVTIVVKKATKIRSIQQNRYYWGVVVKVLSEELGYTDDEIHEAMRSLFLSYPIEINNSQTIVRKSTTELTTSEFEEYTEKIRRFAASELNIQIPEPNEEE